MQAVRRQTREDKKKMALAMRQKQLEALGMVVRSAGFFIFTLFYISFFEFIFMFLFTVFGFWLYF